MDIGELSKILYDATGPAKIGIDLKVEENDTDVEPNTQYLFEFLVNLLIIGLVKLKLPLDTRSDVVEAEKTLQFYFNRLNMTINVIAESQRTPTVPEDFSPYCQIVYDNAKNQFHLKLLNEKSHGSLETFVAIYKLDSGDVARISFM